MSTSSLAERSYQLVGRPSAGADWRSRSNYHTAGLAVAVLGLMAVMAASIADFASVKHLGAHQDTLAWSFGLNFVGFNVIKLGIGVTLMGIIIRLWMRVESVKVALVDLKADAEGESVRTSGELDTPYGRAEISTRAPESLWIHKLAEYMWTPLLVMGPMVVAAGLALSIVQANKTVGSSDFQHLGAVAQGASILGEALMLSGISFILGTILSSLRKGGGEVQEDVGVPVQTLKVPYTVWAFVGLMAVGLMSAIGTFVLLLVTTGSGNYDSWTPWLGQAGLFSLGTLLAGIVLALYSIGDVLGFTFTRIRDIITIGR
jgi:hypothetical protein